MCFKNGKKLHINNCLTYQLINVEIYSSLGSYLREKKLSKYKENIRTNYISNLNIQTTCTNKSLPHLLKIVMIRDFCYTGELS